MKEEMFKEILFPHDKVREIQNDMISDVHNAIKNKKNMILHAPTGIGKTVSVLGPALSYAMKNKLTVFFLTSRHTQHNIAINTLKQIKKKHDVDFSVADIIGKKWMCLQPGIEIMPSGDFTDYCKKLREDNECEFYSNTLEKSRTATVKAKKVLNELKILPLHVEELIGSCDKEKLCPYEMAALIGKEAKVIITDYYYIFNDAIRENLLKRIDKELEKCIIIVDEGHNLPGRIRDLLTINLTNIVIERAIKEAAKFGFTETFQNLKILNEILFELSNDLDFNREEKLIRRESFTDLIKKNFDYEELISDFEFVGDEVREKQKQSYVGSIVKFLEMWLGSDIGFARILSKKEVMNKDIISLSYRCLDPSLITKDVIERSYSTLIMSGTLNPTFMYKDVLGFSDAIEKEYESPFPKKNRLNIIIPETTTKYSRRGKEEFSKIADICAKLVNAIPGNTAIFFPSYDLRDSVYYFFNEKCKRKIFLEKSKLNKQEKEGFLENFKNTSNAVLLAAASGSFGEGIDLPGVLKGVIIVGLPLKKPDLETKELVDYYEDKFGKGFDYGYVFPAITKCLQNAGRCIRSEKDKGVIIFLDERFSWKNYLKCFPSDMEFKISKLYEKRVKEFFKPK
jgi:DNA excision repair protein ERCC-2